MNRDPDFALFLQYEMEQTRAKLFGLYRLLGVSSSTVLEEDGGAMMWYKLAPSDEEISELQNAGSTLEPV